MGVVGILNELSGKIQEVVALRQLQVIVSAHTLLQFEQICGTESHECVRHSFPPTVGPELPL